MLAFIAAPARSPAQAWKLDPATTPVIVSESPALQNAAFAPLPDGRLLAYGNFTHVNGTAAAGLACLRADGSVDPTFSAAPPAGGRTAATVAPLAQGAFLAVQTSPTAPAVAPGPLALTEPASAFGILNVPLIVPLGPTRGEGPNPVAVAPLATLVRLRPDGRLDPAFAALDCDGIPRLMPLADGRILVWGTFRSLGGQTRHGLARLNADGTLDPGYAPAFTSPAPAYSAVTAVAVTSDGSVIASGYSQDNSVITTRHFARFRPGGAIDAGFAPVPGMAVFSLLVPQPDGAVLAGNYTVFRFTPAGKIDLGYALRIPLLKNLVRAVPLADGRMIVEASVGPDTSYGTPAVFTISATGAVETDHRTLPGGQPAQRLLAVFPDGRLLLLQGTATTTIVIANGDTSLPADATAAVSAAVAAATASAADPASVASTLVPIVVQPALTDSSLVIRRAGASVLTPFALTLALRRAGSIARLESDAHGRVVVSGSFTHVDGQPRPGLARFNTDGTLDPLFAPAAAAEVLLVPPDGRPVVRTAGRIARLRDDGAVDAGFTFPATLSAITTRWLAGAPDGRLLISAFVPDDRTEANLKLIWLGPDGTRLATLPTVFGGFAQSYIAVSPAFVKSAPTAGEDVTTGSVTSVVSAVVTSGAVAGAGSAVAVTVITGSTTGTTAPTLPVTPGTPVIPITPIIPTPVNYYVPNAIFAARILPDNRLLVRGSFWTAGGLPRSGVVWLGGDGSVEGPRPADTPVSATVAIAISIPPPPAVLLPDGRALVFENRYSTSAGFGVAVQVKRMRADGTEDPEFSPAPNTILSDTRALADGSLFSAGRLYSADGLLDRNFAPQATRGGSAIVPSSATLAGGQLWVAGSFEAIDGAPRAGLARFLATEIVGITFGPRSQTVVAGRDALFDVVLGTNQAATYRWTHDGVSVPGATGATLRIPEAGAADAGDYRAVVTLGGQVFTSERATLTIAPNTARLVNFSARSIVGPGAPQLAGIACAPVPPRVVLLRSTGRGLVGADGAALLPAPVLTLYWGTQPIAQDRGSAPFLTNISALARRVGAFPVGIASTASALAPELGGGVLTAATTSGDNGTGMCLFEFYDTGNAPEPALVRNFSARGQAGTGAGVLTAGIVIGGDGPLRVLVRGIGPALAAFGVTAPLADPVLHVFAAREFRPLATNDNWSSLPELVAAAAAARAFPLPAGSRDAALVLTLEPGAYTAQLVAAAGGGGEAMIEFYALDR